MSGGGGGGGRSGGRGGFRRFGEGVRCRYARCGGAGFEEEGGLVDPLLGVGEIYHFLRIGWGLVREVRGTYGWGGYVRVDYLFDWKEGGFFWLCGGLGRRALLIFTRNVILLQRLGYT